MIARNPIMCKKQDRIIKLKTLWELTDANPLWNKSSIPYFNMQHKQQSLQLIYSLEQVDVDMPFHHFDLD